MDHRRSRRGYHSSPWLAAVPLVLSAASCVLVGTPREVPPAEAPAVVVPAAPSGAWPAAKAATLVGVNAARAEAGLAPVVWDATLERVGDAFCAALLDERGFGHVATDGVVPYLRVLLAGEPGFHRENVGAYDSTATVTADEVEGIASRLLADMLAETPPDDGHRRTILEPTATHLGVGVAVRGGSVRVAHEISTRFVTAWRPPSQAVRPLDAARLAGRLAPPWRPVGVEVLWEPLPSPRTPDTPPVRRYAYPPVRSITFDQSASTPRLDLSPSKEPAALEVSGSSFAFTWKTGPRPGVETTVVWARRDARERALTPVAAATTVVTPDGVLPPALARWAALRGE